jgi:hypothetical protein
MLRIPTAPVWAAVSLILGVSTLLQLIVMIRTARGDYPDDPMTAVD